MNFTALLAAAICLLATTLFAEQGSMPSPSEKELTKSLGGADVLKTIRTSDRIEAVRVKEMRSDPKRFGPFVEAGQRFDLPEDQVVAVREFFGNRNTYIDGASACIFDPGIKFILHSKGLPPLELLVCFHCGDLEINRDGHRVGFTSFANGYTKMLDLARKIFPKDEDIRKFIEDREAQAKHDTEALERWQNAIPKPLQAPEFRKTLFAEIMPNVEPLRAPLSKGITNVHERIRVLLNWFGSGAGPWSGFPGYEVAAEQLLLDYPTPEILAAMDEAPLTETQTEGAARLFGGWDFSQKRPQDLKTLPAAWKKTLLEHSLRSTDEDKRGRAERAFK